MLAMGLTALPMPAFATVISLGQDGEYVTQEVSDFRYVKPEITPLEKPLTLSSIPKSNTSISDSGFETIIASVAENFPTVSKDIIRAVIKVESNFKADAVSIKGAQGLMQLMPATAAKHGVKDAFDPLENIYGGASELAHLMKQYEELPLVLAAYNAGEGAVNKYDGIPPYAETQDYVVKVLKEIIILQMSDLDSFETASLAE